MLGDDLVAQADHRPQMNTPGPEISWATSFALPQNEHRSPPASIAA
jgi:hypothetical protein